MIILRTLICLGIKNVFSVVLYRLSLKVRLNKALKLKRMYKKGEFFRSLNIEIKDTEYPNLNWVNETKYFGLHNVDISRVPDWHKNVFSPMNSKISLKNWWEISDFDSNVGDIKIIWEASRFEWALSFSQQIALGNSAYLEKLNFWINDWCDHNPPFKGRNWKCGQEASIRIMNLAYCAFLLEQIDETSEALLDFIKIHLERIEPTVQYAVAQDNNHGSSEAAALYIGGSWLGRNGYSVGEKWAKQGKKLLENRVQKLIMDDGSFSQNSVNYHRMLLNTVVFVEVWNRRLNLDKFSDGYSKKLKLATEWLFLMIANQSGDVANIGANDGSNILSFTNANYRDFRPTVQLASILFFNKVVWKNDRQLDAAAKWINLKIPNEKLVLSHSKVFEKGGYVVLSNNNVKVIMRLPKYKFRPSQSDALHLDLWCNNENILRDAGTYSYNTEDVLSNYFPGTRAHNTVEFDDRDQMPRIGRFLFGDWLNTKLKKDKNIEERLEYSSQYKNRSGHYHRRNIHLKNDRLEIVDQVVGFREKAVLRWRLSPGDWSFRDNQISNGKIALKIVCNTKIQRMEVVEGEESRYYLLKTGLPVLEIEIRQAGEIKTEVFW